MRISDWRSDVGSSDRKERLQRLSALPKGEIEHRSYDCDVTCPLQQCCHCRPRYATINDRDRQPLLLRKSERPSERKRRSWWNQVRKWRKNADPFAIIRRIIHVSLP